jgi:tRNA(Ile)-lysidine synthetase-like protein
MIQALYQNLNFNLEKILKKNQSIVVGVSGGQDSCVLLDLLVKSKLNLKINVCHFNHMLRKKSADLDQNFVKNVCSQFSIPFYSKKFNILRASKFLKKGIEETGRLYRKKFFEKIAAKTRSTIIVLGHHNNDQIETFLMRLIRGTSSKGLSSMSIFDGLYFRPLLEISKTDIQEYAEKQNISWVEDKTNTDEKYTRNNIRKNLVPSIFKINPNFDETIKNTLEHISDQNTFVANRIQLLERKIVKRIDRNDFIVPLKKFNKLSLFERRELLYSFLNKKVTKDVFVSFKNISDLVSLASTDNASGKFFLTNQVQIRKGYDFLFIQLNMIESDKYDIEIKSTGSWEHNSLIVKINKYDNIENSSTKFFNFSSNEIDIKVRNFKNGDRVKLKNSHEKKLQDIFTDNKVPQFMRSKLPVFETKGKVFYIYGLDIDTEHITYNATDTSVGISAYSKNLEKLIDAINL